MKKKPHSSVQAVDLNSPEALEDFRKAAEAFNARVNRSAESALKQLVKEGIYTKAGRLTKNYS